MCYMSTNIFDMFDQNLCDTFDKMHFDEKKLDLEHEFQGDSPKQITYHPYQIQQGNKGRKYNLLFWRFMIKVTQ